MDLSQTARQLEKIHSALQSPAEKHSFHTVCVCYARHLPNGDAKVSDE
jgi:hypothetical protein